MLLGSVEELREKSVALDAAVLSRGQSKAIFIQKLVVWGSNRPGIP